MVSRVIWSSCKQWRPCTGTWLHEAFRSTRIRFARFYKLKRVRWIPRCWRTLPWRYWAFYKLKLKKFPSCFYLQGFRIILFPGYHYCCWNLVSHAACYFYSTFYIRWQIILFFAVQVNCWAWVYCLYFVSYCHHRQVS